MCFGQDKLVWFPHGATAERWCKGVEARVQRGGRVSRSLWKRVMLAISLRQCNDGQLSCLKRSVLGVRKGREGWSGQRLPGHVQWPWHLAQEDCHARQETHTPVLDVESISTVVPLLLDVVLVLSTSTSEALHVELLWEEVHGCGHASQDSEREQRQDVSYTGQCRLLHLKCGAFKMRSMPVCMLVVIIFVFAWPKRPRQEIAQFSAEVTASWSGDSDTSWLCWWAWCKRASSVCSSVCTRLMLQGRSFMKITKSTGPRCDPCGTPGEIGCGTDWPSPTRTVMWRPDK